VGIVVLFAGLAVAGPAIMVRDAARYARQGVAVAAAGGESIVTMADLRFSPQVLQVPAGTVVIWRNEDIAPHTVTTYTADSGVIDPGGSFKMTVERAFAYVCSLHPGMAGTVQVG